MEDSVTIKPQKDEHYANILLYEDRRSHGHRRRMASKCLGRVWGGRQLVFLGIEFQVRKTRGLWRWMEVTDGYTVL